MEESLLRWEYRSQLALDEVASSTTSVLLDTWLDEQQSVWQLELQEPADLVSLWRRSVLWEKLSSESQRLPQELRHEREEVELESSSRLELLPLRWPVEPVCEDVEERQH